MDRRQLPIDKGWAWVVSLASCGIFGFVTGAQKARGIILVELQEKFPESSTALLIWVLGLNMIIDRILGPVNGMILARTSHRTLSIMGSCIMTASLVSFAYSSRIEYMFVFYTIYGLGTGMNSLSCMTVSQPYFKNKKALSLGITGSGAGLGVLVLSAVLRLLFDNFSFSGAMLLYSGVCMQTLILASLFRPFSYYDRSNQLKEDLPLSDMLGKEDNSYENSSSSFPQGNHRMRSMSLGETKEDNSPLNAKTGHFLSTPSNLNATPTNRRQNNENKLTNTQILALSAQDISTSGLILDKETAKQSDAGDKTETSANWKLALHPRCILLGICTTLHVSALISSYPSIPPLGVQTGVSKKLVSVVLAIGGGIEVPVRLLNGWLADKNLMTAYNQLTLYMFFTGVTAFLCATLSGAAGIVLMLVGLSCAATSVYTLLPVICAELFGSKNVPVGMSIIFVYQGLAMGIGSFSSGIIYDYTQRWENVFYYVSGSMTTAGTIMLVTSVISYCINKKKPSERGANS